MDLHRRAVNLARKALRSARLRYAAGMAIVLSILMLTAFALVIGAIMLFRRKGMTRQVWLMALLAIVVASNIAIWTWPDDAGHTLIGASPQTAP